MTDVIQTGPVTSQPNNSLQSTRADGSALHAPNAGDTVGTGPGTSQASKTLQETTPTGSSPFDDGKIVSVDGTSITGTGTSQKPLKAVGGGVAVVTDGVTLQGNGTGGDTIRVKAIQHDGTLTGSGTVADPLSVPPGDHAVIFTDGVTLTGDGAAATPAKILAVQCNPGGIRSIDGAGTLASKLTAVALQGGGSGFIDTTQVVGGVPLISVVGVDAGGSNVAIQAQNSGAVANAGNVSIACDGAAGSSVTIGSRTNTADLNIGNRVGAVHDNPKLFLFDLKDCAGLANVGVSPAGQARFAYDLATDTVYVSKNGAAFVAVVTL